MKTTHFNKLLLTSLVLVALTGCGKDEEKSSAAAAPAPAAEAVVEAAPEVATAIANTAATGAAALSNLQSWYGSTTENSVPSTLAKSVTKAIQTSSGDCVDILIWEACYSLGISTSYSTSFVTAVSDGSSKSDNSDLAAAVEGASGWTMINVSQAAGNYGHPVYTIQYGKSSNGAIKTYKVDSGLNSAFNPVSVYNSGNGRYEFVYNTSDLVE